MLNDQVIDVLIVHVRRAAVIDRRHKRIDRSAPSFPQPLIDKHL